MNPSHESVPADLMDVMTERADMTANVIVTMRCNGPGCGALYAPTWPAEGSVTTARREAAGHGWTRQGAEHDLCPRCSAPVTGVIAPTLFDSFRAGWVMRLDRLDVDQAPADLEGRVPASATFSPCTTPAHGAGCRQPECRPYRYDLTRIWDPARPLVAWVMCNPSTATAEQLDPTLRKCKGFSERWGAGGMVILNLFALRSTDPRALTTHVDPVGPDNDLVIVNHFPVAPYRKVSRVIFGWGPIGKLGTAASKEMMEGRAESMQVLMEISDVKPECLAITKDGGPGHPLYIPYSAAPVPWPGLQ